MTQPSKNNVLVQAVRRGDADTINEVCTAGAELNARDTRRWTPLHHAVDANQPGMVDLLSVKGTNLNARNADGKTPLAMARDTGRQGLIESLLSHGAHDPPQAFAATPTSTPTANHVTRPPPATNAWRGVRETESHAPSLSSRWGRSDEYACGDSEPFSMDHCWTRGLSENWQAEPANIGVIDAWREEMERQKQRTWLTPRF